MRKSDTLVFLEAIEPLRQDPALYAHAIRAWKAINEAGTQPQPLQQPQQSNPTQSGIRFKVNGSSPSSNDTDTASSGDDASGEVSPEGAYKNGAVESKDNMALSVAAETFPATRPSNEFYSEIKRLEGFKPNPYPDAGKHAIGYGSQTYYRRPGVKDGTQVTEKDPPVTEAEAFQMLLGYEAARIQPELDKVTVPMTQKMVDALASFCYNAGNIYNQILAPLNRKDYVGAMNALRTAATTSQGKRLQVLVNRRQQEAKLFAMIPKPVEKAPEPKEPTAVAQATPATPGATPGAAPAPTQPAGGAAPTPGAAPATDPNQQAQQT
jgi:GH24 family phage-related lysozyme (muramidase)